MDLFMGFFTIIFLMFLVSAVYLTTMQELHKRSKGISIEYASVQEIEKILKEKLDCSFVKEIGINNEENIEFKCKYYIHTGVIKDGKFYIDEKGRKFSSHRDVEESWYLQKYIEGIIYPEKEDKEKVELKFSKYIKIFNISRIIKYICFLCILIWVFLKIGGMDALKSKGVSQMYFTDYSEEITIGEALKETCSNGKWSSNKIGDSLYYVTFSGYGADGSLLTILFQTNGSDCSIESVKLNGEDITLLQNFLLESIYENLGSGKRSSETFIKENFEKDAIIAENETVLEDENTFESETDNVLEEEAQNDNIVPIEEKSTSDSEEIPIYDLGGHYGGMVGAQSVLDFSVYTDDSDDGCIGVADIYVEGGQYAYNGEVYEIATNLYEVAVDTGEEVLLSAYRYEDTIILQLYVDGELITEYALMYYFQS